MAAPFYKQVMYVNTSSDLPAKADDGQLAYMLDTQSSSTFSASANAWVPLGRQMVFKSTVSINAKTTGTTLVYTLPASPLYFYPTQIVVRNVNISGVTTAPSVSIGSNSTNYDNIAQIQLLPSLLATLGVGSGTPQLVSVSPPLSGSTGVYAKVTTGATATNYTVKYDILGFYDSSTP